MEKKIDFLDRITSNPILVAFIPSYDVRLFIACQFALESDFGTSHLAVTFNNYCGMKVPHRRMSYRDGSSDCWCVYICLDQCIHDYVSWLLYSRPYYTQLESVESFMIFLRDSGYCPEKDYISRINSIYQQFKFLQNEYEFN